MKKEQQDLSKIYEGIINKKNLYTARIDADITIGLSIKTKTKLSKEELMEKIEALLEDLSDIDVSVDHVSIHDINILSYEKE